jgi:hypothetical protein
MTFKQAANWASDIKEYTQTRKMPPWKPVAGPAYAHERKLTDAEIATLAAWADANCPEGNPADAPPPRKFPQGWQLGTPDLVLTVPEDFTVGPGGTDLFRCFVLPTGLTEDKAVVAFEVRPGNPRVVHHTLNFVDTAGQARKLEQQQREKDKDDKDVQDFGPGYSVKMGIGFLPRGGISGWAPGQMPRYLPDGVGYALPKNSDIVIQTHYHRTGRVEKDRTQIGFYFAQGPVRQTITPLVIGPKLRNVIDFLRFNIPADDEHYVVKGSIWAAEDCTILSVMPHMHLIGREIKVTMTPPDGPATTLVAIKDWDYNWQETYFFKEPIRVKAGTRFDVEGVYNNTATNPNNPFNPPQAIRFGEQTTNEMCFGFLQAVGDKPGPVHYYIDEAKTILMPPRRGPAPPRTEAGGPAGK